jgi:hypothetical protein
MVERGGPAWPPVEGDKIDGSRPGRFSVGNLKICLDIVTVHRSRVDLCGV